MRTFKYLLILCLTAVRISTQYVYAQTKGAHEKANLDSTHITKVLTLPNGVVAGELDARGWLSPYNGLYLSRDLGQSWTNLGLEHRGITDIAFCNEQIYVATYYVEDNSVGIFKSHDLGKTFTHLDLDFSTSQIECLGDNLVVGGYSHGLWVSNDQGTTWAQKLGDGSGLTGPNVKYIKVDKNFALASTAAKTYISRDFGNTWIETDSLNGVVISSVASFKETTLAATLNSGLFTSTDQGLTWVKNESWGEHPISMLYTFKNTIYAQDANTNIVYTSTDSGKSWEFHNAYSTDNIKSIDKLISYPSYFFMSVQDQGIYKAQILPQIEKQNKIFEIPWDYTNTTELVERLSAYFDHHLPLGFYDYHGESNEQKETTLNFLGLKEKTPLLYYSGHNGTDFSLPYGSNINAPASGIAQYYYCNACGHSIKIDHQNGYQTTYMHLQKKGLISTNYEDLIEVSSGTPIGKVGMTGNTTGPHLHFSVMYDANNNGIFDDYPDGLIDPFGWKNKYNQDPWGNYEWTDISGKHKGSASPYLWLTDAPPH